MTIIAWDGKILAADKRLCFGSLSRTCTKIYRYSGCLIGTSGDSSTGSEMEQWFREGCHPSKFPSAQRNENTFAPLLVINSDGIWRYDTSPYSIKIEDKHYAIGSGAPYAITAMLLGKSAYEAVEIACLFDTSCGNGIDVLELI